MPRKIPALRSAQVVSALERAGFVVKRQSGSHIVMLKAEQRRPITVPMHRRDLPPGTVRAIVRQAGLTVDQFLAFVTNQS
jgi:predicted RNA binding protein YcfA (HicA-like mRNA interferase family)